MLRELTELRRKLIEDNKAESMVELSEIHKDKLFDFFDNHQNPDEKSTPLQSFINHWKAVLNEYKPNDIEDSKAHEKELAVFNNLLLQPDHERGFADEVFRYIKRFFLEATDSLKAVILKNVFHVDLPKDRPESDRNIYNQLVALTMLATALQNFALSRQKQTVYQGREVIRGESILSDSATRKLNDSTQRSIVELNIYKNALRYLQRDYPLHRQRKDADYHMKILTDIFEVTDSSEKEKRIVAFCAVLSDEVLTQATRSAVPLKDFLGSLTDDNLPYYQTLAWMLSLAYKIRPNSLPKKIVHEIDSLNAIKPAHIKSIPSSYLGKIISIENKETKEVKVNYPLIIEDLEKTLRDVLNYSGTSNKGAAAKLKSAFTLLKNSSSRPPEEQKRVLDSFLLEAKKALENRIMKGVDKKNKWLGFFSTKKEITLAMRQEALAEYLNEIYFGSKPDGHRVHKSIIAVLYQYCQNDQYFQQYAKQFEKFNRMISVKAAPGFESRYTEQSTADFSLTLKQRMQ